MNYDHKHQLAFLLSLAALPIGGCVISDGDDDDDVGDDSTGTADDTNTMTAADDDSATMTMTADDTGTATVDDSGSSSGGGTADDTAGTTGGEVPQVCTDVGAHYEKCMFKDAAESVDECAYYLVEKGYTGDCLTANEDYYACLAVAACEDFAKGNPCQAEIEAATEVCLGGEDTGTDTGGSDSSTGG